MIDRKPKITGSVMKGECVVCGEEAEYIGFRHYTPSGWYRLCDWHFKTTADYPTSIPTRLLTSRKN